MELKTSEIRKQKGWIDVYKITPSSVQCLAERVVFIVERARVVKYGKFVNNCAYKTRRTGAQAKHAQPESKATLKTASTTTPIRAAATVYALLFRHKPFKFRIRKATTTVTHQINWDSLQIAQFNTDD